MLKFWNVDVKLLAFHSCVQGDISRCTIGSVDI